MKPIRFLMVGGFLGAGKTTTIARLARHYTDAGLRVGVVTNDQAFNLVDTHALRAQGFDVGEVPGACFCCKFDDLIDVAAGLSENQVPDVILAEPVGSCTDLVATVVEPLRKLHGDQYEVGGLAVLLKPEHGFKILGGGELGFSPKAAYIFLKQIEEADVIVLNKIDKLQAAEREQLLAWVGQRFPDKEVLAMSARTGEGFPELVEALDRPSAGHAAFMDVDYDTYAEGEAELGWLNCQVEVEAGEAGRFSLDRVVLDLVLLLAEQFAASELEPAHLKILAESGSDTAIANLVAGDSQAELSLASLVEVDRANLVVNARVAADPEQLERDVDQAVQSLARRHQIACRISGMQRFRPGRPVPTHRFS